MKGIVEIVFDMTKKKYRAKDTRSGGWVRFPNHLRTPGACYEVEILQPAKAGSLIAKGEIRQLIRGSRVK